MYFIDRAKKQQRMSGGLQNLERGQPRCKVGLA